MDGSGSSFCGQGRRRAPPAFPLLAAAPLRAPGSRVRPAERRTFLALARVGVFRNTCRHRSADDVSDRRQQWRGFRPGRARTRGAAAPAAARAARSQAREGRRRWEGGRAPCRSRRRSLPRCVCASSPCSVWKVATPLARTGRRLDGANSARSLGCIGRPILNGGDELRAALEMRPEPGASMRSLSVSHRIARRSRRPASGSPAARDVAGVE